jgi:flagellin-like protein
VAYASTLGHRHAASAGVDATDDRLMNPRTVLTDDDAVSPVIGVVLMVAITVTLVGLIGPVVLDVSSEMSSSPPRASFEFTYTSTPAVTITHVGGAALDGQYLDVTGLDNTSVDLSGQTYRVGDTLLPSREVAANASRVRVVWVNPSGGSSNVIGSSIVPRQ